MNCIKKYIDDFLDSKTMYRLVLETLTVLAIVSIIFGFIGIISYNGTSLLLSLLVIGAICYVSNYLFAKIVSASRNIESVFITALILFFIVAPATNIQGFGMLALAGIIAMASKYVLAIRKKHVFNPAAISIFLLGLFGVSSVIWWVATPALLPLVIITGFLILRKINKFRLFFSFLIAAVIAIFCFALWRGASLWSLLPQIFTSWPIIFFGTIMLTEPLTAPSSTKQQTAYALLVGFLFGFQFQLGPLFSTPELALILGNIYSYLVSPKYFLKLILRRTNKLAYNTYEVVFSSPQKLRNVPGQYLEWTLPHKNPDNRGIRRYFTIASSPTENDIKIGIRISPENGSSFKKQLLAMQEGESLIASGLTGDFVLPKDKNKKLAFIAGGIGITPFRSQLQYLIDKKESRPITLLYGNKKPEDIAYRDILDKAKEALGIKVVYALTDPDVDLSLLPNSIRTINAETIMEQIPDYKDRMFYLSGPRAMIENFEEILQKLGVSRIKTDFFPGFS